MSTSTQTSVHLGDVLAQHSYELEVVSGDALIIIDVSANSRDQARRIAEQRGFVVKSVNMVG
jgi:hypothetical protein